MEIAEPVIPKKKISGKPKKYNLSVHFLLPIVLSIGYRTKGFINSYLYNSIDAIEDFNYYIYVLMESETLDTTKERYITHYKTRDGYLYKFLIDDYKKDIELFLRGKYSLLSDKLKDKLCWVSGKPEMLTEVYKILYRTQDRREKIEELIGQKLHDDAEVCSIVEISDEMYMGERDDR